MTDPHPDQVNVSAEAVIEGYTHELATVTRRALVAEAALAAVREQLATAREDLARERHARAAATDQEEGH